MSEFVDDMCDARLKPRILRSLLRDRLPDESRPLPGPAELSSVLAAVKTHGLLSEQLPENSNAKMKQAWSSSVDAWVDRVLSLTSSKMPDKCWAGLCLLGVTCEECSTDRFIGSYSLWFQKLLTNVPSAQHPHLSSVFVKAALCASLSDFFTRLATFSSLKKDATLLASKVIPSIILLLKEDGSVSSKVGAVDLLCNLIRLFPSSVHRYYEDVEAVIVANILPAKGERHLLKKLACCLALIPMVRGDESSWSLMVQKIVVDIDVLLNDAFQELEERRKMSVVSRLLVPPGRDPPSLGIPPKLGEISEHPTKRLNELIVPAVSTLMQSCSVMLTNPYPIQVTIPVRALIALIRRVLEMDGSLSQSSMLFATAIHQELLCQELPTLHMEALDLLIAIIKGVRSQFLPHAANIVRILTEYFQKATFSSVRIKVYSILQMLLISMGCGMAMYLAKEVKKIAFADLSESPESKSLLLKEHAFMNANQLFEQKAPRKRKHASISKVQSSDDTHLEVSSVRAKLASHLSVKIAAVKTLETLLTVWGSLSSSMCLRSDVDLLLINVASKACDAGWGSYEGNSPTIALEESIPLKADFQLAALQALLTSLLSPSEVRPPHLSEALELFHRGKLLSGTKVASFCAHALMSLEVLIHPRVLPIADSPISTYYDGLSNRYQNNAFFGNYKGKVTVNDDVAEEIYDKSFDSVDEEEFSHGLLNVSAKEKQAEGAPTQVNHIAETILKPSSRGYEKMEIANDEGNPGLGRLPNSITAEAEEHRMSLPGNNVSADASRDDVMLQNNDTDVVLHGDMVQENYMDGSGEERMSPDKVDASDMPMVEMVKDADSSDAGVLTRTYNILRRCDASSTLTEATISRDSDSDSASLNSLPDIIAGDPDSDSD